jgi:hypothetical protein
MVKIQLHPQGSRVKIRKGHFPLDPSLEGRTGTVIQLRRYGGSKYGVQFDGESQIRVFAEDELEPLGPGRDPENAGMKGAEGGSASPA